MNPFRNIVEPIKIKRELRKIQKIDDTVLIAHHVRIQRSCNRILFLLDMLDPNKPKLSLHAYFMEREEQWYPYQALYGHTTVKQYLHNIIGRISIDDIQPTLVQGRTSIEMVLGLYRLLSYYHSFPKRFIQGNHYDLSFWEQDKHITYIGDLLTLIEKHLTEEVVRELELLYPYININTKKESTQ